MAQASKEPVQLPVRRVVPDELTLSVELVETRSQVFAADDGLPGSLFCVECAEGKGWVSYSDEWANRGTPQCPNCDTLFKVDEAQPVQLPAPVVEQSVSTESQTEPRKPAATEQAAIELLTQVGAESVAAVVSKPLVDEWLDLELRLEMLKDEFEEQKAAHQKAKKACQKRINEIQNELRAESRGETYTPPVEEKPKQLQIPGTGD